MTTKEMIHKDMVEMARVDMEIAKLQKEEDRLMAIADAYWEPLNARRFVFFAKRKWAKCRRLYDEALVHADRLNELYEKQHDLELHIEYLKEGLVCC